MKLLVHTAILMLCMVAYGRFQLQFKDGTKLDGWFSTVYVKTPFGWKALLTHT